MPLRVGPSKVIIEERKRHWDTDAVSAEYLELQGRAALDFAISKGASHVQLMEYVRLKYGDWQGMRLAETLDFSYADGRRITVRQATPEEEKICTFRPLPKYTIPFQISLPASILRQAEHDAILLLRIGAIANSLQTILMSSRPADQTDELIRWRDGIHRAMIVASFLHEARQVMYHDKSHKGRLWELVKTGTDARRDHIPADIVAECRRLLDDKGPLVKPLRELRDSVGFHALPNTFRLWLRKQDANSRVLLQSVSNSATSDVVFAASSAAIRDTHITGAVSTVLSIANTLSGALPYLIEAAIWGLITEQGIEHHKCIAIRPSDDSPKP